MNWIKVLYPRRRCVSVDGTRLGYTNQPLLIGEDGTYSVDLGEPKNYSPQQHRPTVSGTTRRRPLELTFVPDWV